MSRGASEGSRTLTVVEEKEKAPEQLVLRLPALRLLAEEKNVDKERPHVTWAEGTVDNEHLGRLKSNCCCIWVPPRRWDDPSTWEVDEAETEHCRGHTLPPPKQPSGGSAEKERPSCCDH